MDDDPTTIVEHATCLACGCLCDDIRVVARGGRIVEAENACAIGRPWFLAPRPGEGSPAASIDGRDAVLDEAIGRAVELLRTARAPLILGLSRTTVEAVASALRIADRIGAVVDAAGSLEGPARLSAFQRVGLVSSSLGEVKDRADVVVFWGVDPVVTHPRHWSRYSVDPGGRFTPRGRLDRFVIVVDEQPTETSRLADLFVPIRLDRQPETLDVLRALVKGIGIDPSRSARSTGLPHSTLVELADKLKASHYGAFFHGPGLELGDRGPRPFDSAYRLVRDLNEGRRFVALDLGRAGNEAGAAAVLAWQAGAPSAVDFGLGHPRHLPEEATSTSSLVRGEVDLILFVGDDPGDTATLGLTVPSIAIAPGASRLGGPPTVAIDVARPGLESGGTVARVDGVMLPLRPVLSRDLPTDREVLDEIARRLDDPA